jgi:hypothetical protein
MGKQPKRAKKRPKPASERARELWLLLVPSRLMEIYKLHARPEPLRDEQWNGIAKLGPPKLAEARSQIESAIDASRAMRAAFSEGSKESAGLAIKRRDAGKIRNALERVTSQIEDFIRREETEDHLRPSSIFQHAMAGLRYVLAYFDEESKAHREYDWALYYLIRDLDFIWKEHTGQRVRRSGKNSEAYVVEVCQIALEPIEKSTIINALKHYRTARRLVNVTEKEW